MEALVIHIPALAAKIAAMAVSHTGTCVQGWAATTRGKVSGGVDAIDGNVPRCVSPLVAVEKGLSTRSKQQVPGAARCI